MENALFKTIPIEKRADDNSVSNNLFELQCLIQANNIHLSAQCQVDQSYSLAFISNSFDLGIYYKHESNALPIIRKISWFQNTQKKVSSLCFDSIGFWLLVVTTDSIFYIIPFKTLVNENYPPDQKWSTNDITSFPPLSVSNSSARPTSLVWWRGSSFAGNIGIIGTEQGEILFFNLENGTKLASTGISSPVLNLIIYQDIQLDTLTLLITSDCNDQWQLILENPSTKYIYPLNLNNSSSNVTNDSEMDNEELKNFPSARSRLHGLKQLSVEKLVTLKQKLAESRSRNFKAEFSRSDSGSTQPNDSNKLNSLEQPGKLESDNNQSEFQIKCTMHPVAVTKDINIIPNLSSHNITVFVKCILSTSHIFVHENSLSMPPTHMHQLPNDFKDVLITNQFFFITDLEQKCLKVISRPLSKIKKNDIFESKNQYQTTVAEFLFEKSDETILNIHLFNNLINEKRNNRSEIREKMYKNTKTINDSKIHIPPIDSCIIVTNWGIYKIFPTDNILSVLLNLILKYKAVEEAIKLAFLFGIDTQQLIEYAGDIILCDRQFKRAMELYHLAGSLRRLKSVLKLASFGYTSELLSGLTYYLTPPAVGELSVSTRVHFSNLSVLAFTELILRSVSENKQYYKTFLQFLSTNILYDELLAINVTNQTYLWSIIHHLAKYRGLSMQVLEAVLQTITTLPPKASQIGNSYNPCGLLICLSEPTLMQGMLNNFSLIRNHIAYILINLPSFEIFVLQRLIMLFNPTNPILRPLLLKCRARRRNISRSSVSSQCDSLDLSEESITNFEHDEINTVVEEIVEVFLQVLLTSINKKHHNFQFSPNYLSRISSNQNNEGNKFRSTVIDFKRRLLGAGYGHVAIIRNGHVYTWGNCIQGCLGTGPTISRYSMPQPITLFRKISIEVLGVSCGRSHTLAVTNNGLYAWGSNKFGQLGLDNLVQCPNPEFITSLSEEIIVEAVAGQYHSVAVTEDGRVFTWGWGVHGQLGHGNTEKKVLPTLVTSLLGIVIKQASAGHAHTAVLSADGYVYTFGCNLFGQLGTGSTAKSSIPLKVSLLHERITLISTKYFHNLAVSCTNKLYVWGASPQVLRLQSQAQKKMRLHQTQSMINEAKKSTDNFCGDCDSDSNDLNSKSASNLLKNSTPSFSGVLEESQEHLAPVLVDTSLVEGRIVQISTGCHHSALLTKDGTVYTWGRNLDGQIGNGTRREVLIPTMIYDPSSAINAPKSADDVSDENSMNSTNRETNQTNFNLFVKAVKICCGSDFTVIIQPGGNVMAWGNNNMAQLGRAPGTAKDAIRGPEEKVFLLKSSKRIIRHVIHTAVESPVQVTGIPAPTISYQSYDVTPLAGKLRPLYVLEQTPDNLTLHYTIEQFYGFYNSYKMLNKCIELKNYQACSKIELLENNIVGAITYQFEALKYCLPKILGKSTISNPSRVISDEPKQNFLEALFERHVKQNVVDNLVESVERERMKMPNSKSLDSFQILLEDVHIFDCQGGPDELFNQSKCDSLTDDSIVDSKENEDYCSSQDIYNLTNTRIIKESSDNEELQKRKHALKIIDYYLKEADDEIFTTIQEVLIICIDFWVEQNFLFCYLEEIFLENLEKIGYSLGLLLFCQHDSVNGQFSNKKIEVIYKKRNFKNLFSSEFCLKVCSAIVEYIEKDKPISELIGTLSLAIAKNYGPPLTGYPGTNENKTPEQMMDGILNTLSAKYRDPRPYIHIKDIAQITQILSEKEDSMIFTCGHSYFSTSYKVESIPKMETELLMLSSPLPTTADYLSSLLRNSSFKVDTLCPTCLPRLLDNFIAVQGGER